MFINEFIKFLHSIAIGLMMMQYTYLNQYRLPQNRIPLLQRTLNHTFLQLFIFAIIHPLYLRWIINFGGKFLQLNFTRGCFNNTLLKLILYIFIFNFYLFFITNSFINCLFGQRLFIFNWLFRQ